MDPTRLAQASEPMFLGFLTRKSGPSQTRSHLFRMQPRISSLRPSSQLSCLLCALLTSERTAVLVNLIQTHALTQSDNLCAPVLILQFGHFSQPPIPTTPESDD